VSEPHPEHEREDDKRDGDGETPPSPSPAQGHTPSDAIGMIRRGKNRMVAAIIGLSLVYGVLIGSLVPSGTEPPGWMVLGIAIGVYLCGFAWLRLDERETGYRRSPALNVAILLLALIGVPAYFVLARPPGQRLRPVLGFGALVITSSLASAMAEQAARGGGAL